MAQSEDLAQRVYRSMAIIVLFLLAASALGCISTAISLLLNGYWWQAGLLCLAIGGLGYLARAYDLQQFPETQASVSPNRKP